MRSLPGLKVRKTEARFWAQVSITSGMKLKANYGVDVPDKLGSHYKNDLFVADANTGSLYHFDLSENRTELELRDFLKTKLQIRLKK